MSSRPPIARASATSRSRSTPADTRGAPAVPQTSLLQMGRLAGLVLILLAGAAALTPVADSDIWWHLAAGREMIARRGFLWVDPFSLGARGRPWIDLHWL